LGDLLRARTREALPSAVLPGISALPGGGCAAGPGAAREDGALCEGRVVLVLLRPSGSIPCFRLPSGRKRVPGGPGKWSGRASRFCFGDGAVEGPGFSSAAPSRAWGRGRGAACAADAAPLLSLGSEQRLRHGARGLHRAGAGGGGGDDGHAGPGGEHPGPRGPAGSRAPSAAGFARSPLVGGAVPGAAACPDQGPGLRPELPRRPPMGSKARSWLNPPPAAGRGSRAAVNPSPGRFSPC